MLEQVLSGLHFTQRSEGINEFKGEGRAIAADEAGKSAVRPIRGAGNAVCSIGAMSFSPSRSCVLKADQIGFVQTSHSETDCILTIIRMEDAIV